MNELSNTGVVVIGRNEGDRLKLCLASLSETTPLVYVDSGSKDGSLEVASSAGFNVVALSPDKPFTAARARNAGIHKLLEIEPNLLFIQTVDGDCIIHPQWIAFGRALLRSDSKLGAVFGRLHERFPDRSVYNRMCDIEWNVPIGIVDSCGGNALHRVEALVAADGFNEQLIAGEEPDLCLRLKNKGWRVARVDHDMGQHDAAIIHFSQYWRRSVRSGHAYAEHVWNHGRGSFVSWKQQLARILFWGLLLPCSQISLCVFALLGEVAPAFVLLPTSIFAVQFFRQWARNARPHFPAASLAILSLVGKIAEAQGGLSFFLKLPTKRQSGLIEYKNA